MKVEQNNEFEIIHIQSQSRLHMKVLQLQQNRGHRSEAPKIISDTAPATTVDTVAKPGRFHSGTAEDALVLLLAALPVGDGVVSPSELDTLPRIELSKAQMSRMFFTSEGKLGVSNTAV